MSTAAESPTGEMMAGVLRPGRERLLDVHIIASGRCWVSIDDGERHWAEQGDVVVLPYGHQHKMAGAPRRHAVTRKVGDEAEEACSRAFKRASGVPPARWRAARST